MKYSLIIFTLALIAAATPAAEIAAFVEQPEGFIIGGRSETGWLISEAAGKAVKAGTAYRLFTLTGEAGKATGAKPEPNRDVDMAPVLASGNVTPGSFS